MAFKTDSIKLKNYADVSARNTAIGSPAAGDVALTNGVLQVYTSAWANVDTAPSHSHNAKLDTFDSSDVVIPASTGYNLVTYYVTVDQDADNDTTADHALKIKPAADYGTSARVEIINASNDQLIVSRNGGGDANFLLSGDSVLTVEIGTGQRALFLRLGTGTTWEVVILSL